MSPRGKKNPENWLLPLCSCVLHHLHMIHKEKPRKIKIHQKNNIPPSRPSTQQTTNTNNIHSTQQTHCHGSISKFLILSFIHSHKEEFLFPFFHSFIHQQMHKLERKKLGIANLKTKIKQTGIANLNTKIKPTNP
jgi:hypothetical protein